MTPPPSSPPSSSPPPWVIKKDRGKRKWKIVRKDTGKVVGTSLAKKNAIKSLRARYAYEKRKHKI